MKLRAQLRSHTSASIVKHTLQILFLAEPKTAHQYKPGITFDRVLRLYRFDKKLRVLLFNEIEKIEVAFRAAVVNTITDRTGDIFWMTNPSYVNAGTLAINLLGTF